MKMMRMMNYLLLRLQEESNLVHDDGKCKCIDKNYNEESNDVSYNFQDHSYEVAKTVNNP